MPELKTSLNPQDAAAAALMHTGRLIEAIGQLAYFVVAIVAVGILVDAGKVVYSYLRPDVLKMVLAKES
jgi:hypothetical protein